MSQAMNALTHGDSYTRLYSIWVSMKQRCLNPNNDSYDNYGGKGVKIFVEWIEYEPFRDWALSNGYIDELTIDRIDSNGNYCPSNCRWITKAMNTTLAHQKRFIVSHNLHGVLCVTNLAEFARQNDCDASSLIKVARGIRKSHKGWDVEYQ